MVLETAAPALVRRLTAAVATCLLLTACGGGESSTKSKEDQPILTEKSVVDAWKSYDERNNAAMPKAGPPTYDGLAYATADIGPLLEEDDLSARIGKVTKEKASKPSTHTSQNLYAPVAGAGFALSSNTLTSDPKYLSLSSLVRDEGVWKQEMSPAVDKGVKLPEPLAPGKDSTASSADVDRVREVADGISTYWETLRKPDGVVLGNAQYAYFAKDLQNARSGKLFAEVTNTPKGFCRTSAELGEALRVVRVSGGLLALVCLRMDALAVVNGPTTRINDNGFVAQRFGKKPRKRLHHEWHVSLAITLPDDAPAKVIANSTVPVS